MKVVVLAGYSDSLIKFRGQLIYQMVEAGHEIIAIAGDNNDSTRSQLAQIGASYECIPLSRKGLNPFADLHTLFHLVKLFRRTKPDVLFAYTAKPVIWGAIAAKIAGVKSINTMLTGLGGQFDNESLVQKLTSSAVKTLYKIALRNSRCVIFQNSDDLEVLLQSGIVTKKQSHVVNGSGVDIQEYPFASLPSSPPVFLTIARFLKAKGLREFAAAARVIKTNNPEIVFRIVGYAETGKSAISASEIKQMQDEGFVEIVGKVDNADEVLRQCHVYVLASYYGEGLPRTILEAMAIGRPILTTNNVGCREPIQDEVNGKLVEPRSVEELVAGMQWFLHRQTEWESMGLKSRQIVECTYDVKKVNAEMLRILKLQPSKA